MAAIRPTAAQPAPPPSLVVAKPMFSAAHIRADPAPVARDDIQRFHSLLDAALLTCSPANLQTCKDWLLNNTVNSPKRIDVLAKYLASLAQSFAQPSAGSKPSKPDAPSNRRKVLHILYLLQDLVHHLAAHNAHPAQLTKPLEPYLELIFTTALSLQLPGKSKLRQRLAKLTALYQDSNLYSDNYRDRISKALKDATVPAPATPAPSKTRTTPSSKEAPYTLPAFHGEPDGPWYDLPAGALMPHIRPNDPRPINPNNIKAVDLRNKSAEMGLINAVKDLLAYSNSLYSEDEGIVPDIDMMGQPLVRDELTGELTVTEGYYGWSVDFCESMKKRRREAKSRDRGRRSGRSRSVSSGSRSRSLSRDRGRSRSPDRKRRYNPSRSRSRSEKRRRDTSSYSRPRMGLGGGRRASPSRSPYRSRSRSQGRGRNYRRSPPPSHRLGSGQSPPLPQQAPPHPYSASGAPFPPPPPPQQFPGQFPSFPNFPHPPPPPPNYNGPWPPPPPPPPPMGPNGNFGPQFPPFPPQQPNVPMAYPMPGVPPPPPPPNYQGGQHWQQQKQGWSPPPQQGGGQQWQQNNGYDRGRGRRY